MNKQYVERVKKDNRKTVYLMMKNSKMCHYSSMKEQELRIGF